MTYFDLPAYLPTCLGSAGPVARLFTIDIPYKNMPDVMNNVIVLIRCIPSHGVQIFVFRQRKKRTENKIKPVKAFITFIKTNTWFNACYNLRPCITYSAVSCKLAASFSTLSIFTLSSKNSKLL